MNSIGAGNSNNKTLWSKDYIFLTISNFFLFFGDSLLLPVLPVYVREYGASNFEIGVVTSVFFATSILMRIFTSRVSARIGKRTLLVFTMIVFALAMLGYYLYAGLFIILILRLVQGLSFGAATTLYSSMTANIIPNERMGEGMGYFGLGVSIAFALGPCLGAAAVSRPYYKWVFIAALILEITAVILTLFIKVDNNRVPVERIGIKEFVSDIVEPKAIYEGVLMAFFGLSTGGIATYIVLFAKEMSIENISLYFIVTSIAELSVRMFSGKLFDKKGMNPVLIPGTIAGIISLVLIAFSTNLWMICISAFINGLSMGMIFPVVEASAMKNSTPERRLAATATLYNMLDIGSGLSPMLFGIMIQLYGYSDAFLFSSLIFVLMLVVIIIKTAFTKQKTLLKAD